MTLATRPMVGGAGTAAQELSHKMFGIEYGIVSKRVVEAEHWQIEVQLPRLPNQPVIPCRWSSPIAGKERGFYWLPEPGDEVVVAFERGEQNRGVIIGCLWNDTDKPPVSIKTWSDLLRSITADENTVRMIATNSGHKIVFDDDDSYSKIHIEDAKGKLSITLDCKENVIHIRQKGKDKDVGIKIEAKADVAVKCKNFRLEAEETIELKTKKGKMAVDVKDKLEVKAGPKIQMNADRIDLNP